MKWLKKGILITSVLAVYVFLVRPVRVKLIVLIEQFFRIEEVFHIETYSTTLNMLHAYNGDILNFSFKMPFGLYFILTAIGLVIFEATKKEVTIFLIVHLSVWGLAFIFFLGGITESIISLVIMDFLVRYLLPISTLGFIPFILMRRRGTIEAKT